MFLNNLKHSPHFIFVQDFRMPSDKMRSGKIKDFSARQSEQFRCIQKGQLTSIKTTFHRIRNLNGTFLMFKLIKIAVFLAIKIRKQRLIWHKSLSLPQFVRRKKQPSIKPQASFIFIFRSFFWKLFEFQTKIIYASIKIKTHISISHIDTVMFQIRCRQKHIFF